MEIEITMSIFGKCTEEIKTRVSESTKLDFAKFAHEVQMNESELLRHVVHLYLYGEDQVLKLQQQQLNLVASRRKCQGQK